MADEVIGFVQRVLLEVTGAVSILRDNEYIVLRNKTWSPLQGSGRRAWLGEFGQTPQTGYGQSMVVLVWQTVKGQ